MKSIYMHAAGGLVLALVLTQPVLAERGQDSYYAPPSFSDLDVTRDAALDKGEVQGRSPLYGQWNRYDTDRDGLIEPAEFAAFEAMDQSLKPWMPKAPLVTTPSAPAE